MGRREPRREEEALMAWDRTGTPGRRRTELDARWYRSTRPRILRRDRYRCKWGLVQEGPELGARLYECQIRANQVDHIGDRNDNSDANLRSLCESHHQTRTGWQGNQASQRAHRDRKAQRNRPEEPHPGGATRPRT